MSKTTEIKKITRIAKESLTLVMENLEKEQLTVDEIMVILISMNNSLGKTLEQFMDGHK